MVVYGLAWLLMTVAALGFAGVALRINRHEVFPGQPSLLATASLTAAFLAAVTVLSILARLDAGGLLQPILLVTAFGTGLTIPLAWLRFALQYTGQRFPTGRWTFVRLGLPVLVTFAVIVLTTLLGFLNFELGLGFLTQEQFGILDGVLEYSTALTGSYLAALLVVGASLIAWTSFSFRHLSTEAGVLLGIGFVIPWVAPVIPTIAGLFDGQPLLFTYHVAVGGIVGLVAAGSAIGRYDLLSQVPAAGTIGRDVTVEEMNAPVLVTDESGRVIDLNTAAEDAFEASVAAIGQPVATVLDGLSLDDLVGRSGGGEIGLGQRTFETTASELRDEYGRVLGHSFVFHDVTERKRREQRIQVLNRVLRHNLRNDLNTVNGYAELAEQTDEPGEYLVHIRDTASRLIAIGEKAREIEEIVASERQSRSASLPEVVTQSVAEVRDEADGCSVEVHEPVVDVDVNGPVLTSVLVELVENACQHSDVQQPEVEVETALSEDDQLLTITVTDNGPGIPDHELAPLQEGTETALEHGSGLGLWLFNWGVGALNGSIDFRENDPRGTVATLHLPAPR